MAERTAQRVWTTALGQLELYVTRANYETRLRHTVGLGVEPDNFVVGVPTALIREWLVTRLRSRVVQTVSAILGRPTEVSFEIVGDDHANGKGEAAITLEMGSTPPAVEVPSTVPEQRLNPRYTFKRFVVGDSNRMAVAAAIQAADNPGMDYNPIFIHSPPGLGKTHLLHAIAHHATRSNKAAVYVTSEQFTNQFVTALTGSRSEEFRRHYRSPQLLLVDDIQFLAGKSRTQEEFSSTFNDLHSNSSQVVVAADKPPASILGVESRLCSRFQWGLVTDIQPPDTETRMGIVKAKAADKGFDLPDDVAALLAERAPGDTRELEGLLSRVLTHANLTHVPATLDHAVEALTALPPASASTPDANHLLHAVSAYFAISTEALAGKSRARPVAEARHTAMYLLREDGQLGLKQIGFLLGQRDHSTVIHGVQKVSHQLKTEPTTAAQLSEIRDYASHVS